MAEAMVMHDDRLRFAVESHGGYVVKMTGDGILATFDDPLRAVDAGIAIQSAFPAATQQKPSLCGRVAAYMPGKFNGVAETFLELR